MELRCSKLSAVALVLVFVICLVTADESLSGCQVCASTGDCSHAYLGSEGKFCGNWLDQTNQRQRCCCPNDATCKVSNYACKCSSSSSSSSSQSVGTAGWIGGAVGVIVLLSCCIGGCWCFFKVAKRAQRPPPQPRPLPVAQPIPVGYTNSPVPVYTAGAPGVSPCNVMPVYPHPTAPVYDYSGYGYYGGNHYNGGGSGFSSGLGAVAGLAAGMLMVDAIADAGHHHGGGYDGGFNGGGGFDGGFDGGGGDFGGDF